MSLCTICGVGAVPDERLAIGMTHCTADACVAVWRERRIADNELTLVLVPKQGMTWVTKSQASGIGKSSGRS